MSISLSNQVVTEITQYMLCKYKMVIYKKLGKWLPKENIGKL
jgi:hypothetical protein